MKPFWSGARLRRLGFALTLSLALAVIVASLRGPQSGSLFRGDFPAFYASGVIVSRGMVDALYNNDLQAAVQNEFYPEMDGQYLAFAYPTYVAYLLEPLASLPPGAAKGLTVAVMFFALTLAMRIVAEYIPAFRNRYALIFALSFLPLLSGLVAAQNTALSLLLWCAAFHFLRKGEDLWAGLALGLWMFKPHFALIALGLVVLGGRWRVALGAAPVALAYYVIPISDLGTRWPFEWVTAVSAFAAEDYVMNGHQMISVQGVAHAFQNIGLPSKVVLVASIVVLALIAIQLLRLVVRRDEEGFARLLAVVPVAIVLISPHTLYYESALAMFSLIAVMKLDSDREIWTLAAVLLFAGVSTVLRPILPVQPLVLLMLWIFFQAALFSTPVFKSVEARKSP